MVVAYRMLSSDHCIGGTCYKLLVHKSSGMLLLFATIFYMLSFRAANL
jgi:hypothetical protein